MTNTIESLYNRLGELHKQIEKLKKRLELWKTLPKEQEEKLEKLGNEYIETHYKLVDMTFTDNIEPFLYNEDIIYLKQMMDDKYQWSGEIIFDDEYLLNVLKSIKDIDELYNIMDKIEEQELQEVKKFIETEAGKEVEYAFGQLILNKEDTDSITKYITGKNKIIKKMFNTYFNLEELIKIMNIDYSEEEDEDNEK